MAGDTFTRDRFDWLEAIAGDNRLHSTAIRVAVVISKHLNRLSGEAFPKIRTIASMSATPERSVERAVSDLCKFGYLERRRWGFRGRNLYSIPETSPHRCKTELVSKPATSGGNEAAKSAMDGGNGVSKPATSGGSNPPPVADQTRHEWRHNNPLTEPFENEPFEGDIYQAAPGALKETPRKEDHSASFEEFWKVYPRRVSRGNAKGAFAKALKKASAATIIAGARRYAAERAGQEPRFTKHAATWLNGECWTDETPAAAGGAIIDLSGNILGQAENPDRFRPRTPGQQREDDINAMVSAALRRATS